MFPRITSDEAESLLRRTTTRDRALAILAQAEPPWFLRLAANLVATLAVFRLMTIDAPTVVRIALAFCCVDVPTSFMEQRWSRRRLDAVATLIKLSDDAGA